MPWDIDTPGDKPWDHRDSETTRAYEAFVHYRDLGPARSLRKAAETFYAEGTPHGEIAAEKGRREGARTAAERRFFSWSSANDWRRRVAAWDEAISRVGTAELIEAQRNMRIRHAAAGTVAVGKAIEKLRAVKAEDLSLVDVARLLDIGTKVERLARDLPSEVLQHQGPGGGPIAHEDVTPSVDRSVAMLEAMLEAGVDFAGGLAEEPPAGEAPDAAAEVGATDGV
jgi:hypothetical protein